MYTFLALHLAQFHSPTNIPVPGSAAMQTNRLSDRAIVEFFGACTSSTTSNREHTHSWQVELLFRHWHAHQTTVLHTHFVGYEVAGWSWVLPQQLANISLEIFLIMLWCCAVLCWTCEMNSMCVCVCVCIVDSYILGKRCATLVGVRRLDAVSISW